VTQGNKVEDVEMDSGDDVERSRGTTTSRKGKGKVKAKGSKKKPAAPADGEEAAIDVDSDLVDVPDEPFDRGALVNQPLSQKQLLGLRPFASEATVTLDAYKPDVMEMAKRLAGHIAEFMRNNQDKVRTGPLYDPLRLGLTPRSDSRRTGFNDEESHGRRTTPLCAERCRLVFTREAE